MYKHATVPCAEGDLRKKQKRYAMLADLQSQAQVCLVHLVWAGVASCSQSSLLERYIAGLLLSYLSQVPDLLQKLDFVKMT